MMMEFIQSCICGCQMAPHVAWNHENEKFYVAWTHNPNIAIDYDCDHAKFRFEFAHDSECFNTAEEAKARIAQIKANWRPEPDGDIFGHQYPPTLLLAHGFVKNADNGFWEANNG